MWSAGMPEAHTAAFTGHQRGKSESYQRYSKKSGLRPLKAAIAAIDYGNKKWSWLEQRIFSKKREE